MENKFNDLKPLYSCKKSYAFQMKLEKMLLHWRGNLADQNKQQPREINMRVMYHDLSVCNKPLTDTCQYCSTSRANQVFKIEGLSASVSFLPFPLPPLSFFGSRFTSRVVK